MPDCFVRYISLHIFPDIKSRHQTDKGETNKLDLVKVFIENILYPVMEKKNGNRIRKYLTELTSSQQMTIQALNELQTEKLKALLLECIANVPAYRPYAYLKDEIETNPISALKKIPILDKDRFRDTSENFINDTVDKSSLISNITGGSTGQPLNFYMDRRTVEHYEAARWRGLSWSGITPGSRSVMIWGNPIELDSMKQKSYHLKERWLKNRIIIPAYSLKSDSIINYINRIERFKPEYFYGYASALHAFAILMLKEKARLSFVPKAVVSTAETLHDFQREAIESAFGCRVVNEYGARDAGILAFECEHGGMHITVENAVFEVVDPITSEDQPIGENGALIVTDLNNFSMPRLRYKLGDSIALSDKACTCGRGLPLLDNVVGREDDVFLTIDGKLVHGHVFSHIARSHNPISKFQIRQHSPQSACLHIVLHSDSAVSEADAFIRNIKDVLPGTDISVSFVDEIPAGKSGKYRYAIREFDLEQGLKEMHTV